MEPWQRRAWLLVSIWALLVGWMAPQYAMKLWGPGLSKFLADTPLSGAILAQSFWVIIFVPGVAGREQQPLPMDCRYHPGCGQGIHTRWLMPLALGCLVLIVHAAWFASMSRTNVATNTLLWNTDTVTTPLVVLLVCRERPTLTVTLGGVLSLLGAGLAVGAGMEGDTFLGCGLCLLASLGFAVNCVLVERFRDPQALPVKRLLGQEGVVAVAFICSTALTALVAQPEAIAVWWLELPALGWLLFLGGSSLSLNIGWLWCTELAGAYWTAMVACSTIPISMLLDVVLIGTHPNASAICGALLVILGFTIASQPQDDSVKKAVHGGKASAALADGGLSNEPPSKSSAQGGDFSWRWRGWAQERSALLLVPAPTSPTASTADSSDVDAKQSEGPAVAGHPNRPSASAPSPAAGEDV